MCAVEAQIATPPRARGLNVPAPVGMLGDDRLARLAGDGNERAFATLYARFHQPLYRYCNSMLRHEADAQDALQSTFASALVALRRGQRDAPLRPWLFRIAHNESISLLRKRRPTSELPETMEAPALSVEAAAEERQRLSQLVADLQELPERQRGALVMRELSGLSHEELAQALGISVGAAKQTVFEARRALAEFGEGRAMACEQIQRVISDGDGRALRARRVRAHLRECSGCSTFAAAIPERSSALLALSPALPAATAAGLFTKITGASTAHHGSGGLLAGTAGKGIGAAVSSKALATGVAIVATAAAGTAGIVNVVDSGHSSPRPAGQRVAHNSAASGSAASPSSASAPAAGSRASSRSNHGSPASRGAAPGKNVAQGVAAGLALAHSPRAALRSMPSILRQAGASTTSSTSAGSTGQPNGSQATQPGSGATNPNAHGGNPNAGGTNAGSGSSNPNAHGGNPNANGGNSSSHSGSSNAHGGNPNAAGGNPNAGGGNTGSGSSNAHGGNLNAGGGNPNDGGGNTTVGAGNSNAGGVSTTAHGGNPNAGGGNPNAGGANSHGHGHLLAR
jgi:RNA polymerase sigma factor (sigma-70 family)